MNLLTYQTVIHVRKISVIVELQRLG